MKSYKLFIDDLRPIPDDSWVVVRSCQEACDYVSKHGVPSIISFDHDLGIKPDGTEESAFTFAKWLVEQDLDGKIDLSKDFTFKIHSANPVGRKNIEGLLQGYLDFKRKK